MDQEELVTVFVKELEVHLESVESDLVGLQKDFDNIDEDVLNSIFRGFHNIKAASGFYHFTKISELSHKMETLLSQLHNKKLKPTLEIIEALLTGVALVKTMLDDIGKSNDFDIQKEMALLTEYLIPEEGLIKLIKVKEKVNQGKEGEVFEIPETKLETFVKNGQLLYTLKIFLKKDWTQKGKTLFDLINTINNGGEFIESNLDTDNIQGLADCLENDLSFVILFATDKKASQISDKLKISKENISVIDMTEIQNIYGVQKETLFLMPKTNLVASQIEKLRDSFLEELKANPNVSKVVFKADEIETVDSLGVNLIIGIYRQVKAESKIFEITGAGEAFLKVANFFQFQALFKINHKEQTQ